MAVLTALAGQIGLPVEKAHEILENGTFKQEVDADWERCRTQGISSIPQFVAGGQGVSGAQPYPVLEQLVQQAGAVRKSVAA